MDYRIGIILSVLWFIGVLSWDVNSDYKKWLTNTPVKHTKEAWIRALLLIPCFLVLLLPIQGSWVLKCFLIAGLMSSTYLLFFDGLYNKKRKLSWWSLGSIDADDAWTDRMLRKLTLNQQKLLKIGLPVLFAISYALYVILL